MKQYKHMRCKAFLLLIAIVLLTACSGGESIQNDTTAAYIPELLPPAIPWYDLSPCIAHALGTISGRRESNCAEAFAETYSRGQRVFEVDLSLTSDGFLAARHDFEAGSYYTLEQEIPPSGELMDYNTFMSTPVMGIYTAVDINMIADMLGEYSDIYFVTDTKSTDLSVVTEQFTLIRDACDGDERLDRIIVQLYNTDMYDAVSSVYDFKNYIFTCYQLAERDYNAISDFCAANGIDVVTIPAETATEEIYNTVSSRGLKLYVHTVNRITTMYTMTYFGLADGFYSDYVTSPELTGYIESK